MLMIVLNVIYVLVAIAMIALILLQRGSGAAAGSGFGAGASGTVFGARGAANFLSKSTKWLAVAFFGITLGMARLHLQGVRTANQQATDLGVMAGQPQAPANAAPAPAIPQAAPQIPQAAPSIPQAAPAQTVPSAPATSAPVTTQEEKPAQGG